MLRDKWGRFRKGNKGFWLGKKRPSMQGEKNWRWMGGDTIKSCLICRTFFSTRGKRRLTGKFCSQKCAAKWKFSGEKNVNWKGGVPREKRDELPEYRLWRTRVYQRDGWTCKICNYRSKGKKMKDIVAHHIKSYQPFPQLRFEVNNGITLCRKCHCGLHAKHRKIIDFTEILRDYMPDALLAKI